MRYPGCYHVLVRIMQTRSDEAREGEEELTKSASAACKSCCSAADRVAVSENSVSRAYMLEGGHVLLQHTRHLPGERVPVRTALTSMLGRSGALDGRARGDLRSAAQRCEIMRVKSRARNKKGLAACAAVTKRRVRP